MHRVIILIIISLLISNNTFATTVTLQDGLNSYTGEKDARINPSFTNEEDTSSVFFQTLTGSNWIIYFDVSSIPSSASVSSASLTVFLSEQNCTSVTASLAGISNPDNSGAFPTYATAQDNFNNNATWAFKNHTNSTKWNTAGSNNNFTDVNAGAAVSTVSTGACPGSVTKTFTGLATLVQGWVTSSNSNGGMFLVASGSKVVSVGQFGTQANRPSLSVTYSVGHNDVAQGGSIIRGGSILN